MGRKIAKKGMGSLKDAYGAGNAAADYLMNYVGGFGKKKTGAKKARKLKGNAKKK